MNENRVINIVNLLELLSKEGFEQDIFGYAIWKLICKHLHPDMNYRGREQLCIEECKKEIAKWISVDK